MILMTLALLALAGTAPAETPEAMMTVNGEGRIAVAPDMATVRLGVVTEAPGAREAIDENSRAMAGVLERLAGLGIEGRDIQTTDFSVQPRWVRPEGSQAAEITGFVARNLVMVRVRELDLLGNALDAVTRDGANAFEGVQFGLLEPGPIEDQARRAAVADARDKAALYAEAAGVELGPLLRLSEQGAARPPMPMARAEMAMASDAVPVATGELTVTANITLVYGIAQAE